MAFKLSERLKTIVDLCDLCDTIVDIGTDHGFVPIALANKKMARHIIATDIKKSPIDTCKKNAKLYLEDKDFDFQTLVSDGLKDIDKDKPISIIISGMGFDAIKSILENIEEYNYNYMILSPHTKQNEFMKFLTEKNLVIDTIKTVYEDDIAYFIYKVYSKKVWDRLYGENNES